MTSKRCDAISSEDPSAIVPRYEVTVGSFLSQYFQAILTTSFPRALPVFSFLKAVRMSSMS